MSKYAFIVSSIVQAIVDEVPDGHPDLQKMYVQIPVELVGTVMPGKTNFINGMFSAFNPNAESFDAIMKKVRGERNALLTSTDRYMLADYPSDADTIAKIKGYRETLRNFPETVANTITEYSQVVFPANPLTANTTANSSTTSSSTTPQ